MSKWTESELAFVEANWRTMSHEGIATEINRSVHAVRTKCWRLGLVTHVAISENVINAIKVWYSERVGKKLELRTLSRNVGLSQSHICTIAKNHGLTDLNRKWYQPPPPKYATKEELHAAIGKGMRDRIAKDGHPRGMLGKRHSLEAKKVMAAASASYHARQTEEEKELKTDRMIATKMERYGTLIPKSIRNGNAYSRCRQGKRADLENRYFRSAWEANYARYLNWLIDQGKILKWEYEVDEFEFPVKRGCRFYLPDFKIYENDGSIVYHEVKGWMDAKSKTKLKRMAKHHPEVKLVLIDSKPYNAIKRLLCKVIPNWE